jgi:DNA-binding protein YbaB
MSDDLAGDIKSSIKNMQSQMQDTYAELGNIQIIGESSDKTVRITMSATYVFEDIEFDEKALQGGVREFKWRIREAWKDLSEKIQQTTQSRTLELLQGMDIPEEIRELPSEENKEEDK